MLLVDFVDGADVRMIQGSGGPGLTLESLADLGVLDQMRGEELESHRPVQ